MSALPKTQQRPAVRRPAPSRRPDLRVVPPVRRTRRFFVALSVAGALGVFGVVSLNALAAEAAFDAQRLERDVAELAARYDELTAEVTVLESPDRVQRIAVDELGMVPVEEPGYLLVEQEPPPATDVALRDDPSVPTLGLQ